MDSGQFMSIFGGLPYMNPFMSLNLSGLCATTKIIQCTMLGIDSVEVSRKFDKNPDDIPDLSKDEFLKRKELLRTVEKWCARMQGKPEVIPQNQWRLICYNYEIVKSAATRYRDFSHMLFTDYTLSRFLIILVCDEDTCGCGNPFHDDYMTLAKNHADRMMCLLKYLHHDAEKPQPKWVRATYVTPSRKLPQAFLDSNEPPRRPTDTSPPILHVTSDNYIPSLTSEELDKIDNMTAMASSLKPAPRSLRGQVMLKSDEPDTNTAWLKGDVEMMRECDNCRKVSNTMPQCARCKLVRYCDANCQRAAWKTHKLVCKKTQKS